MIAFAVSVAQNGYDEIIINNNRDPTDPYYKPHICRYVQTISRPRESQSPDNLRYVDLLVVSSLSQHIPRSCTVPFSVINIRVIEENWTLYMDRPLKIQFSLHGLELAVFLCHVKTRALSFALLTVVR